MLRPAPQNHCKIQEYRCVINDMELIMLFLAPQKPVPICESVSCDVPPFQSATKLGSSSQVFHQNAPMEAGPAHSLRGFALSLRELTRNESDCFRNLEPRLGQQAYAAHHATPRAGEKDKKTIVLSMVWSSSCYLSSSEPVTKTKDAIICSMIWRSACNLQILRTVREKKNTVLCPMMWSSSC